MTQRLFFGLSVDERVGEQLLRASRRSLASDHHAALQHLDDLHLTLCFLGDFSRDKVHALKETANDEFRGLFAPELLLGDGGDAFPSRSEPRSIYATVEEQTETAGRLFAVRNRAVQVAMSHGWRPSRAEAARPFRPHVTLGRSDALTEGDLGDFWDLGSERKWLPLDITLYETPDPAQSKSSPNARYRPVAAWPLSVRPG